MIQLSLLGKMTKMGLERIDEKNKNCLKEIRVYYLSEERAIDILQALFDWLSQ